MSVLLAPSILSADFGRLAEEVQAATEGGADWIHVDVMDGHFVPNISFGPAVTGAVRRATDLPLDVHLMVSEPDPYLEAFRDAGADLLTVHVEACRHLHRTLDRIGELGMRPGIALNPATPVSAAREVVGLVEVVVLMSVNPGFGGQRYIPASTGKIGRMRSLLAEVERDGVRIEVDGGIEPETAGGAVQAGATVLVAGSAVYNREDSVRANLERLRRAAGA